MSRLRDHVRTRCPAAEADARLESYFANHRGADGVTRLHLRVPLHGVGPLPSVDLERQIIVTAVRTRDDENLNELIRIHWEPAGGGPFPSFSGTLLSWGENDPGHESFIELDGSYDPPLGSAGEVFDEALGHEIARRTARALLEELASAIADR